MLACVPNTPLLLEDSLNVLFLLSIYIIRFLKSVISLNYLTSFNSSNILSNIELLKPFDLPNSIPLTETKTLANDPLMSKF